ncbi:ABC transporter permease [Parvibaculum sp.]|uniref:ABC transporter permease n=1 Tax=Parvibaculum sp. TaxID=2024848 RepID=UPI0026063019|nr:ABC transporter permease [Parvibaculum sp.]MCW5727587.1 ABC transporter permease [Parvibaculum sp.]
MLWRVSMGIAAAQLRYRRRQTLVSTLGVALGVGFFVATSALMSGSEQDMVKRLLDNAPHITIKDEFREAAPQPVFIAFPQGAVTLTNTKPREYLRGIKNHGAMVEALSRQPGVVAEAALMGQAIIRYASKDASAGIAGIDPEKERFLTTIESDMLEGSLMRLKTASQGIVIGQGMSTRLGLGMDDLATVVSPAGLVRRMKVVGIFRTGNLLLDEGQAYMLIKDAQVLLDKPFIANRIRIKIADPDVAEEYASQLESRWGYRTESWQEVNRDFLGLFIVRNIITYSIVGAIMAVAAFGIFNIISTVVMEKRRDIAILMSMGFRAGDIERIFLVQGAFVGLIGMFLGWGLGLILLQMLGTVEITVPGLMDTQKLPLEKGPFQFGVGGAFALVSAVVAAWFPARKAAAVRPVDIIRGAT